MTIRHQLELGSVSLVTLAAVAGITFAVITNNKPQLPPRVLPVNEGIQQPTPTPTTATIQTVTAEQPSPDGKEKLTMIITSNGTDEKTYTFIATNTDTNDQKTIYKTILPSVESMEIPFNSWSPDDKYFFINHVTKLGKEAMVFRVDGAPVTDSDQFLNATAIFTSKITDNKYQEITGWASETLLIVNTTTPGGSVQSYWFEVPSKAVIPLATQFYD